MEMKDVIIVGAGLSGIMAAKTLKEQGITDVLLLEKSKSVGGRLATRRVGEGKADHGAQYFTAFTEPFRSHALQWQKEGWVKKWFGGTHSRFYSTNGMNQLAKNLANGLTITLSTKVTAVKEISSGYKITTDSGDFKAKAVIITSPMPQSLEMIENGEITLDRETKESLDNVSFNPCLVAILQLSEPSQLDSLGYADSKLPDGVERMVDHFKKGISTTPLMSVYMTCQWSKENFELADEKILATIVEKVSEKYKGDAEIVSAQLKKWRYSEAIKIFPHFFCHAKLASPLLFAGDAFISPKDPSQRARFESAALSGIAVGKELANMLSK